MDICLPFARRLSLAGLALAVGLLFGPPCPLAQEADVDAVPVVGGLSSEVLRGTATNPLDLPIDRAAPGGVFRKLPGESEWRFVKGRTRAEVELMLGSALPDPQQRESTAQKQLTSLGNDFGASEPGVTADSPIPPAELTGNDVVVFADNFDSGTLSTAWLTGDITVEGGADTWGPAFTGCYPVFSGNYSLGCAAVGGQFCQYDNYQDSYLIPTTPYDMSAFSLYGMQWRLNATLATGDYYVAMYWQTEGSGGYYIECDRQTTNTNGWTIQSRGVYILNDTHELDSFDFAIYFVSNSSNTQLGVYIDDFQLSGTPFSVDLRPLAIIPTNSFGAPSETILYSGQNTWVDWLALNYGSGSTSQAFRVEYFLDGASIGGTTFFGVAGDAPASTPNYPVFIEEPGPHTLKMIVDYYEEVAESFENNNVLQITRTWVLPPRPDLDITALTVSNPAPEPGSTITYYATVKNIGQASSAVWTRLDVYVNRQFPPGAELPGDLTVSVPPLLPGASTVVSLQASSAVPGPWSSYAQVDPLNDLEEAAPGGEANNTAGPVAVAWQAGLASVSGRLAYYDLDYTTRAIPCATLTVYDVDNDGSMDLLTEVRTNMLGEFGPIILTNFDTDEVNNGHLDLRFKVRLQSGPPCTDSLGSVTVAVVADQSGALEWAERLLTQSAPNIPNGINALGDLILAGGTSPYYRYWEGLAHVHATGMAGHSWARPHGGSLPRTTFVWNNGPNVKSGTNSGTVPLLQISNQSFPSVPVTVGGSMTTALHLPDEWDTWVILHEYGHVLGKALQIYDDIPVDFHSLSNPTTSGGYPNERAAWKEGWCNGFAALSGGSDIGLYGDLGWDYVGGNRAGWTYDFETGLMREYSGSESYYFSEGGPTWEGAVAAALLDLVDQSNDPAIYNVYRDETTVTPAALWSALPGPSWNGNRSTTLFAVRCRNELTSGWSQQQSMFRTFCSHGICADDGLVDVPVVEAAVPSGLRLVVQGNPVQEQIRLVIRGDVLKAGSASVTVHAANGRLCGRRRVTGSEAGEVILAGPRGDFGVNRAGVYFVTVEVGGLKVTEKLICML